MVLCYHDATDSFDLIITPPDAENGEGWGVTFMKEDDVIGWFIEQDGKTLHGDLIYDDSDAFIVTVSEEGENGVLLETEDGDAYHFTPVDAPEVAVFEMA